MDLLWIYDQIFGSYLTKTLEVLIMVFDLLFSVYPIGSLLAVT